jgi:serine/threonine protein kinase
MPSASVTPISPTGFSTPKSRRTRRSGQLVALKVFDDAIIERYGDKTQLARIKRELTLVGKVHPHMVQILDGGVDATTGNHFIVMEHLDGPSLQRCLQSVPDENIPVLIGQLASCCEYLETLSLAHRDIKPSNIIILDDYSRNALNTAADLPWSIKDSTRHPRATNPG